MSFLLGELCFYEALIEIFYKHNKLNTSLHKTLYLFSKYKNFENKSFLVQLLAKRTSPKMYKVSKVQAEKLEKFYKLDVSRFHHDLYFHHDNLHNVS